MRGRKPKTSALKMFEGNPGRRSLNKNEPKPAVETPECPVHLDDEAQAEWNRITPDLHTLGLVARVDRAALAAYCQAWSRWVKAEEMLNSTGGVACHAFFSQAQARCHVVPKVFGILGGNHFSDDTSDRHRPNLREECIRPLNTPKTLASKTELRLF
jgi:phage terminase small subunit